MVRHRQEKMEIIELYLDAERPIGVDDDVKKSLKKELDESKGAISVKAFRPIEVQ